MRRGASWIGLIGLALMAALLGRPVLGADVPRAWTALWPNTDFTQISVAPEEIFSGGPPKDGIPAIDAPDMQAVGKDDVLDPREPVMSIAIDGHPARAYPVRYLMWHEIVNDTIGSGDGAVPVAVTFCPLCNSGVVFDRRVQGSAGVRTLSFGVSGLLRHSDMIMYDRQTESWWQQFTGDAIVGDLLGTELTALPALLESWEEFRTRHPDGLVMSEPTRHSRAYGKNPYRNYDSGRPFLYRGEDPPHGIHPLARVVRVGERAWPLLRLRAAGRLQEADLTLSWVSGKASALDTATIADGRDVGTVRVTDSDGRLVVFETVFAFAFHAFHPKGTWMLGN